MAGINRMIMTGRLTKDPAISYTKEEVPLARFTVAVNGIKRKAGKAPVEYFNCVAWRGLAMIAGEYLKKGSLVAIEGKMTMKPYEVNGVKKMSHEVVVDNLLMLSDKSYKAGKEESYVEDEVLA